MSSGRAKKALAMGLAWLAGLTPVPALAGAVWQRPAEDMVPLRAELAKKLGSAESAAREGDILERIIDRIADDYVDPVDPTALVGFATEAVRSAAPPPGNDDPYALTRVAAAAIMARLDSHTTFLDPKAFANLKASTSGEFGGVGMELSKEGDVIRVVAPIDGTPAAEAGVKAGDAVVSVDGTAVTHLSLVDVVGLIRGPSGSRVTLLLERNGAPLRIVLVRNRIQYKPVTSRMEGDFGYLRITTFNEHTAANVETALGGLHALAGRGGMRGLIIDLRNNPGGILDQAVQVADDFLDDGPILTVRARRPADSHRYEARPGDIARGLPIIVLVNTGSASSAEVVAGALRDTGRARLVGLKTFGKGSVQTVFSLRDGTGIKLTTGRYRTPGGAEPGYGHGLSPDVIVDGEGPNTDAQLARAVRLLKGEP